MPEVCQLLLDPYGPVRDAASECLGLLLEPVRARSAAMGLDEAERRRKAEAEAAINREKEGPKVGELKGGLKVSSRHPLLTPGGGRRPQGGAAGSGAPPVSPLPFCPPLPPPPHPCLAS